MNKLKNIITIPKRAAINSVRIKNQSIIMAVICFTGAFLLLFAVMLFDCAVKLKNLTNLPYMEHYFFYETDKYAIPPIMSNKVNVYGDNAIFVLDKFEIVEEIFGSSRYYQNTNLNYISVKNEIVESARAAKFLWIVMPNSKYDASFITGERVLLSGRHITIQDYKNKTSDVLVDEILAKINGLAVGSYIHTDSEESYKIVGIYKTVRNESVIRAYYDVPQNLIIASNKPETAEIITSGTYDVYLKFKANISENVRNEFFEYITSLGVTGEDRFSRYEFISVRELNKINNSGIFTVFNIALASVVAIFIIIISSIYIFINIISNSRQKEILLYKALGEKKKNIIITFWLELVYISIPSIIFGIISCSVLCGGYIKDLFIYFAGQMSPENMRFTSSIFIKSVQNVGDLITQYTSAQNTAEIAAVIFIIVFMIIGICILLQITTILNKKAIMLLTERKN